jgi:hypothetical protein
MDMTEVKKAGADLPVGFCTKCKSNHCTSPLLHKGSWKLIDPKNLPEAKALAKASAEETKNESTPRSGSGTVGAKNR